MKTSFASPANATAPTPAPARGRLVHDAATRTFHWLLALCFLGAYLTAEGERWRYVHITLGYTVIGLLVFRLLFALLGPRRVQLRVWGQKATHGLRSARAGSPTSWLTWQNAAQGVAVLGLLLAAAFTVCTGVVMYHELLGENVSELLEEVHELLGNAFLLLALGHIALVAWGSMLRKSHHWLSMVTGRVSGAGPDVVQHRLRWLAALLLALTAAGWAYQWQTAPAPKADAADAQQYDAEHEEREHDDEDD